MCILISLFTFWMLFLIPGRNVWVEHCKISLFIGNDENVSKYISDCIINCIWQCESSIFKQCIGQISFRLWLLITALICGFIFLIWQVKREIAGSARLPLRYKACGELLTAGNWKKQHLEMKRRGERSMWMSQEQQQSTMIRSMRSKKGNYGRCQMGKKKDLSCQEIWLWMQSAKEQLGNVQTLWWYLVDTHEKYLI